MSLTRKTTTLVKDLELQIDYLIGYAPAGLHWKQEYHTRQKLIDETLVAETTPPAIIDKLNNIQEQLFLLRKRETHDQAYLKYVEPTTKTKLRVNDWTKKEPYYL